MKTKLYLFFMLLIVVANLSCKKEKLSSQYCDIVWDKGRDREHGWFLNVGDMTVRVDSLTWQNTPTNSQYCIQR